MTKTFTADLRRLESAVKALAGATDYDMTLRQVTILLLVAKAGDAGTTFEALVQQADSAPSSVSRTLRKLGPPPYGKLHEGLDLVALALDPADNRRRIISITEKGWSLLKRAAE